MKRSISFRVPGEPVPKGRPRFSTRGHHVWTPAKTAAYENVVRWEAKRAALLVEWVVCPGAVEVEIALSFVPPPSWRKAQKQRAIAGEHHHTSRPDADNGGKSILDALNGILYADDSQVVRLSISKAWGGEAYADVRVIAL